MPGETHNLKVKVCTPPVFTAALFKTADLNVRQQEWIKMRVVAAVECYSAMKKNEISQQNGWTHKDYYAK